METFFSLRASQDFSILWDKSFRKLFLGTSIRLDTTLVDFNEMKWERGDITFLYKGDAPQSKDSFFILDNKLGVYQRVNKLKLLNVCFSYELINLSVLFRTIFKSSLFSILSKRVLVTKLKTFHITNRLNSNQRKITSKNIMFCGKGNFYIQHMFKSHFMSLF